MFECSPLSLYRGSDLHISEKILVANPSIGQIEEFDEQTYFQAVHSLCASGADLKWQLWDMGIDYTKIDDYDLFLNYTRFSLGNRNKQIQRLIKQGVIEAGQVSDDDVDGKNPLQLTLKYTDGTPLDLCDFDMYHDNNIDEDILYNKDTDTTIDRAVFSQIVSAVRQIHFLKRNNEIPGNKTTKMILIEDAKEEAMRNKDKPFESILLPMISGVSCKCGQCGSKEIWDMPIYQLIENVRRIFKIQDATLLLQGAYSGFASLKDVDKKRLDWLGTI